MLQVENGNALTSLENIHDLENQRGHIVGLIHIIHSDETQSSMLFFEDGTIHTATGLTTGDNPEALMEITARVPGGFNYPCATAMMGSKQDEFFQKAKSEKRNAYYCFSPTGLPDFTVKDSHGYESFYDYLERIYTEDLGDRLDMNEAISS